MMDFYSMHFLSACLFSFLLFILTTFYYFYKFKKDVTKFSNMKNLRNDSKKIETELFLKSANWEQEEEKDDVLEGNEEDIKKVKMIMKNIMEDNSRIKAMIERLIIEGFEMKVMLGKIMAEKQQNSDQLQIDSKNEQNKFNIVTVKNNTLVKENNKSFLPTILKLPGDGFVEELTSEKKSQTCFDKNKCSVTGSRSNSTYGYFEMDADLSNPITERKEATQKFNSISALTLKTNSNKPSITDTTHHEISTPVREDYTSGNIKEVLVVSEFESSACNPTTSISVKPTENSRKDISFSNVFDPSPFQTPTVPASNIFSPQNPVQPAQPQPSQNGGFNFGGAPANNNTKTGFNFGVSATPPQFNQPQPPMASSSVFSFGAPNPNPAPGTGGFNFNAAVPALNANIKPTFNFTVGNTPSFSQKPDTETVEELKLPDIALPITTLPKFDFSLAPPPSCSKPLVTVACSDNKPTKISESTGESQKVMVIAEPKKSNSETIEYTFSNPLVLAESLVSIIAINDFKFSDPVCKQRDNKTMPEITLPKSSSACSFVNFKAPDEVNISKPSEVMSLNFKSPDTSNMILKKKTQDNSDVIKPGAQLLTGSIDEIFSKKAEKEKPQSTTNLLDKFKPAAGTWECSSCLLRNTPDKVKCAACETPKEKKEDTSKPIATGFGKEFKMSSGNWECQECLVRNESSVTKCVACTAPKPGLASASKPGSSIAPPPPNGPAPSSFKWGDQFKPPSSTWECPTCMIRNKDETEKCVACETPKPGGISKSNKSSTAESTSKPTKTKEPTQECGTGGFSFNAAVPAFNANIKPTFNFTGGNTPSFSAQPIDKSAWGPVHGRLRHQKP